MILLWVMVGTIFVVGYVFLGALTVELINKKHEVNLTLGIAIWVLWPIAAFAMICWSGICILADAADDIVNK